MASIAQTSALAQTASSAKTYTNPLRYDDGAARTNPDPFGFQYRGRYYCVATDEHGIKGSWSDDLVLWHDAGCVLQIPGRSNYWAPCVTYCEGRFYMYFSCAPSESFDPHDEHLMVASASDPMGPYEYMHTFFDSFSIDPHVVRGDDGHHYMFYSTNDPASDDENFIGTSIFVDRLIAFDSLAGNPRPVVCPTLPEEMFEANRFGDGRDWYTVEGATYLRRRDRAYMTYSGNAYVRENYFVGYSSAQADGPIDALTWHKFPSDNEHRPLIMRSRDVEGTGHNSLVVGPNLVDLWILYHGRDAADELDPAREQRTMRLDPLYFDGGWLDTPAPSATPCPAPDAAHIADAFSSDPALGSVWGAVEGEWRIGECAVETSGHGVRALMSNDQVGCYRAQVWIASATQAPHHGSTAGVVVFDNGAERITFTVDLADGTVAAVRRAGGEVTTLGRAAVAIRDASAFRLLEVEREARTVSVRIDDVVALTVPAPRGQGRVGLVASGAPMRFSAFALNEHVDLWGDRLSAWVDYYEADGAASFVPADSKLSAGIEAARGSAELVSVDDRRGTTTVHDFEVRGGATSAVRFSPFYAGETDRVTVVVANGVARVIRVTDDGESEISEIGPVAQRFSVRCVISEGQLMLRVGGETVAVAVARTACEQRIEIAGARLCGVEITRSATENQRKEEQ